MLANKDLEKIVHKHITNHFQRPEPKLQQQICDQFEQVIQNLNNLDKKKNLSMENKNIYAKLFKDTKKLYKSEREWWHLEKCRLGIHAVCTFTEAEIKNKWETLTLEHSQINLFG